jgi:hypothetical protein
MILSALPPAAEDFLFIVRGGIADSQAHEEAVQLGFWQGIGAFELERVLSGDHEKGGF